MRLGARFSNFIHWPISQKILLLGVVAIPSTLLADIINVAAQRFAVAPMLRLDLLNVFIGLWLLAQVICTLACIPAARAGRDGRAVAYFYVFMQSIFIAGLLYLFGTLGSPMVAVYPALVILWTLYLDASVGAFGLCWVGLWILVAGALEFAGQLPHAPLLLDRSIDSQASPVWFLAVFASMLVLLAVCLSLSLLFLHTRRLQEKRLQETYNALEQANRLIRRYVPTQLAEQILAGHHVAASRPERRRLTIVFSDIEGFTSASEKLAPEALAQALDDYLSEMVAIADEHGGTVNQIVGDGLMVLFGAPVATDDRDHALRAVRMSLAMQQRTTEMAQAWLLHGLDRPFRIRVGINTGDSSVGDFGSAERKLYSGIGLHTNLAARIQMSCAAGKVLISGATWELIGDCFDCVPRGLLAIKDLDTPLQVYEVMAPGSPAG